MKMEIFNHIGLGAMLCANEIASCVTQVVIDGGLLQSAILTFKRTGTTKVPGRLFITVEVIKKGCIGRGTLMFRTDTAEQNGCSVGMIIFPPT